jgi:LEA14-like dessication related protein
LKAELINTRFRVSLKVDNPNPFPMELSSFVYELYGEGRFWADGREKNVLKIPALETAETRLFLVMNFIDMKRSLLDQIINLQDVNYRFKGEALVRTEVDYLPQFRTVFDLSGYSQVFDN